MHIVKNVLWMGVAAALVAMPASPAAAQMLKTPLHLSAVAQDLDRGLSTPLRITINRWSSNAVQEQLTKTLMTSGADKLLDALRDAPSVGSIATTTSLAWDLRYAQQQPGEDGGTHVILGTDRPISFSEQWNGSRTLDYPFTVIELHLDKNGEGDGTLSFATKVIPDAKNNTVVLENWGTQRIRLTQVKPERR